MAIDAARRTAEPGAANRVGIPGRRSRSASRYEGVQLKERTGPRRSLFGEEAQAVAQRGVSSGAGERLPYLESIQAAFGGHDVTGVRAHVGGEASEAAGELGALAYATGNNVAFGSRPDLHTAAHEAAHVVQQRAGVQLKGGVGQAGDQYERHADAVADRVVAGQSAESVLGEVTRCALGAGIHRSEDGGASASPLAVAGRSVQLKPDVKKTVEREPANANEEAKSTDSAPSLGVLLTWLKDDYVWQCMTQKDVVVRLRHSAEKRDPPPLLDTLVVLGAEVAVAGALGGVGKLIESGVLGASESKGAKVIAKSIADGGKAFGKKTVKTVARSLLSTGASSTEAFWESQHDALIATAKRQQRAFVAEAELLRLSPDGLNEARALWAAHEAAAGSIAAIQRQHSLDQWCNYLHHTESRKSGGAIENHMGDMAAKRKLREDFGQTFREGELILVVSVGEPGSKPTIQWGAIGGLNRGLRDELEARPLKSIAIWKNIEVSLNGAKHSFAISPDGTEMKVKRTSRGAEAWLTERAKLAGQHGKGREVLVNTDLADVSLKGKLRG